MVFKIEPLDLPRPIVPQQPDFRPLSEIGDTVAAYRRKQHIADIVSAATDANGNLDVDRAGGALASAGLLDEARPVLALAQQKAALAQTVAHQNATLAEEVRHNRATENNPHYIETPPNFMEGTPGGALEIRPNGGSRFITTESVLQGQRAAEANPPPPIALNSGDFNSRFTGEQPSAPGAVVPPANSVIARIRAARAQGATPDQLEQMLPPGVQSTVHGLRTFELNPAQLSTRGAGKTGGMSFRDQMNALTSEVDQNYGAEKYKVKQDTLDSFGTKGTQGNTTRALNNLVEHLSVGEELIQALNNGNNQIINEVRNKFKRIFGYEPPSNAAAVAPIIGGELNKVIAGANGGGIDERSQAAIAALGQQKSPGQALTDIQYIKRLMAGQAHGLQRQYEAGTYGLKDFREKYLSPDMRAELDKIEGKGPAEAKSTKLGDVKIPGDAVRDLKSMPDTPQTRQHFDAIFGEGAAARILGPAK